MLCRNEAKAEAARDEIAKDTGNDDLEIVLCDLADLDQVQQAAHEVDQRADQLDVLVNNAGLVLDDRELTPQGNEKQFAVNHLAPFRLTHDLLDLLHESAPARIVNVASDAHWNVSDIPENLQSVEGSYKSFKLYSQTKLYNILFTRALARRLDPDEVTANCLHPGVVNSGFGRQGPWYVRWFMKLASPFITSPADAAQTPLHLATSSEIADTTGEYFKDREPAGTSDLADDATLERRLWDESENLTGAEDWPKPREA
jgi:NAD(P)-dependent dehydrogenase (short-subunit alcohol dehydrogenase family)